MFIRQVCQHFLRNEGQRHISTVTKQTKIGLVGCGQVGSTVAHNLRRKGFTIVSAYDPVQACLNRLPPGITTRKSPGEVTGDCDVLITSLPMPSNVEEAAAGSNGILDSLSEGQIWIDHSTTDYDKTLEYSKLAKSKGAHVLEAPITGGMLALQKGNMIAYLGGEEEVADAVRPVLDASYLRSLYVGKIGSAMIIKVTSNMLCAVSLIAASEALMLAKKSDIDLKKYWEAIRLSVGQSFLWDTGVPFILDGTYDPSFSIKLFTKDMQLGYDMARKYKVPMDIHQATLAVYRRAQYAYGDEAPCYIPPKMMEEALKTSLRDQRFDGWQYDNTVVNDGLVVELELKQE